MLNAKEEQCTKRRKQFAVDQTVLEKFGYKKAEWLEYVVHLSTSYSAFSFPAAVDVAGVIVSIIDDRRSW